MTIATHRMESVLCQNGNSQGRFVLAWCNGKARCQPVEQPVNHRGRVRTVTETAHQRRSRPGARRVRVAAREGKSISCRLVGRPPGIGHINNCRKLEPESCKPVVGFERLTDSFDGPGGHWNGQPGLFFAGQIPSRPRSTTDSQNSPPSHSQPVELGFLPTKADISRPPCRISDARHSRKRRQSDVCR